MKTILFVTLLQTFLAEEKTASIPLALKRIPPTHSIHAHFEDHPSELAQPFTRKNMSIQRHQLVDGESEEHEKDNMDKNDRNKHHHDDDHRNKPWGEVLGATIIVNLAALVGVIFLIPCVSKSSWKFLAHCKNASVIENSNLEDETMNTRDAGEIQQEEAAWEAQIQKFIDIFIPPFAAGALLSTVVFMVIPESIMALQVAAMKKALPESKADHFDYEIDSVHDNLIHDVNEGEEILKGAVWRFGVALLAGFMLPIMFEVLFPQKFEHNRDDSCVHDDTVPVEPDAEITLKSSEELQVLGDHDDINDNNRDLSREEQHGMCLLFPITILAIPLTANSVSHYVLSGDYRTVCRNQFAACIINSYRRCISQLLRRDLYWYCFSWMWYGNSHYNHADYSLP